MREEPHTAPKTGRKSPTRNTKQGGGAQGKQRARSTTHCECNQSKPGFGLKQLIN